jgi:hypothetical protein
MHDQGAHAPSSDQRAQHSSGTLALERGPFVRSRVGQYEIRAASETNEPELATS